MKTKDSRKAETSKTGYIRTSKTGYIRDEAFAHLKQGLEDALAFERRERRDLRVTRIQGSAHLKRRNVCDPPKAKLSQ